MQAHILKCTDLLKDAGAITPEFHSQVHDASRDKPAFFILLAIKVLELLIKLAKHFAARRKV